ncbi:MAG: hypothetical protein ABIK28_19400 [Planctomycetota bacterium]
MEAEFISRMDDFEGSAQWGAEMSKRLDSRFLKDEEFVADRVENLVAGSSNLCNLDAPYRGVGDSHLQEKPLPEFQVKRLIELVRRHKEQSGEKIDHFRIGSAGGLLQHRRLVDLISGTEESVRRYSILSDLNIKDDSMIRFVAEHPKFDQVCLTCDAGDEKTYDQLGSGNDFEIMLKNIRLFRKAGKRLVLNAALFRENTLSLLQLPERLHFEGFSRLHIVYPLNTNMHSNRQRLHKLTPAECRTFLLKARTLCEIYSLELTTDAWAFHPELIGTLSALDHEEMYEAYTTRPCEMLYHLTLHPDGAYSNCSMLNRMGMAVGQEEQPLFNQDLLQMLNAPEVLTFRKLQRLGCFPPPCELICGKKDHSRDKKASSVIMRRNHAEKGSLMDATGFESRENAG